MPLFECTECGCVENTACCDYWSRTQLEKKPATCSECQTGQWHGRFNKRSAKGMLIDQNKRLWSKSVVEGGMLPRGLTIIGEVGL